MLGLIVVGIVIILGVVTIFKKFRNENHLPQLKDPLNSTCYFFEETNQLLRLKPNTKFTFSRILFCRCYHVMHPEVAKELLKNDDYFPKLVDERTPPQYMLVQRSLGSVNYDEWREQRSTLSPAFHYSSMKHYSPHIIEKTRKLIRLWDDEISKNAEINVVPWMRKLAMDCLGLSLFDIDFKYVDNQQVHRFIGLYEKHAKHKPLNFDLVIPRWLHYLPLPFIQNFHKDALALRKEIQQIIEVRKAQTEKHEVCFLDHMIESSFTAKQIEDNVYTFFLAGHSTTVISLNWGLYYLAQNPEIQERARREVDSIIGERLPTHTDLGKFTFMDMVLKENLRCGSPFSFLRMRKASKDIQIDGVQIREGDWVTINVYALHHHPDFWEDPYKYDPERFNNERSKGRHQYSFMPFSIGKRSCIGDNFSLMEQKIVLIMLLQKYIILPVTKEVKITPVYSIRYPSNIVVKLVSR